jgi:P-type E1-E2 ATPase
VEKALGIAAALERQVVHPIATAICALAAKKKLELPAIKQFKAFPGYGLEGTLENGTTVAIGLPAHIDPKLNLSHHAGEMLTLLLIDKTLFALRFTDQIREKLAEVLRKIRHENRLTPFMLTGDHEINAAHVGNMLGIQNIFANLRPEDKLAHVAKLSEMGGLAMIGDGINDAPALARATVGISMGRIGSATAVDASDVVLLNDDLNLLNWLFFKAKKTQIIVTQNITLALAVICLVTTPALLGFIPLWLAVLLHEGGTVLVGLNSLRLLK